jgi:hypothetical protein
MGSVSQKLPLWKTILLGCVSLGTIVVIGYSGYEVYKAKTTKFDVPLFEQQMAKESHGTWGVMPKEACTVFEAVGLMDLGYKLNEKSSGKYTCSSPIVEIPSKTGKKTIQYKASGYPDKATNFQLILTINGNQEDIEAIAARKSWAIYASVLYTNLFGQVVGEFSESQMQSLADLKSGSKLHYYVEDKLLISANVTMKNGEGVYTFDISGMPNMKVN